MDAEALSLTPHPARIEGFNPAAALPYGLRVNHVAAAMADFIDFLGFINQQLATKQIQRLETMLMPANFSSIVGEFVGAGIAKHCPTLTKNQHHNGHPDLVPSGLYPGDAILHGYDGIEIKASRYRRGWQGHNPEDVWLMVFVFDSNRPGDAIKGVTPHPFRFVAVVGALLSQTDWLFSGRSATSRRTITASVTDSGYQKMMANWIYRDAG
jgi:hypothetical protein